MKISLILVFAIFMINLQAQNYEGFKPLDNSEPLKSSIRKISDETESISSTFTQEKHLTMLEEILVSEGQFLFRKSNSVRWEYLSPIEYTIVIYKDVFSIKDGEKISEFDLSSNKLFGEINKMIVTSISGDFIDSPDFEASYFESKNTYMVSLFPQKQEVRSILAAIEIYFEKTDLSVKQVKFLEDGEDYTLIRFTNRQVNQAISDKQFELKP